MYSRGMENLGYITTIRMSPEGAEACIEKFEGWEGTRHLTTVEGDPRHLVIWHVPNETVAAGLILSAGGWYDDLVWGDYAIIPNRRSA